MRTSVRPQVRETLFARNGHGDWYASETLASARQLLLQAPCAGPVPAIHLAPACQPPLADALPDLPVDRDRSPQEVWYGVEDLWLRLAAELSVHVDTEGPTWRLVVRGLRQAQAGRMQDLQPRALDAEVFAWRLEQRRGAFVQGVAYEGDDLVYSVTALATIERWPQGQDLGWQVSGLLDRLRVQGRASLAGAGS